MKKRTLLLFVLLLNIGFAKLLKASDNDKPIKIDFYGFINYEMFFDSRQVVAAREGHVMLFPANEVLDEDGNDINAVPNFNFVSIASRFGARISGPDAFGSKTSAVLEGDVLGIRAGLNSVARLRLAYINLKWENSSLLAGQNWHPFFVGQCFPSTVSFAGVVPYHMLNRSPQIKFAYDISRFNLSAFLLSHNDFAALGPNGTSSEYIRNGMQPEAYLQVSIKGESFLFGVTGGYQSIMPRKETTAGYKTSETMESLQANVFVRVNLPIINIKLQSNYSENPSNIIMIGGYGEATLLDEDRQIYSYTGIRSLNSWIDFETNGSSFKAGLLAGYSKNLGSTEDITGEVYARGANIDYMFRISPRVVYGSGKVQAGFEIVYDVAAFGTPDLRYNITDTKEVSNIRTVLALKYFF